MAGVSSESVLAAAEAHDARGDHDGAINVLATATGHGDQVAKTRLGKRLLVGDRSPYLPREGARFILEAAHAGVAEAVALVAVFQCTGVYQCKDWRQALNTLAHAAALGWMPAREQLILMAEAGEPSAEAALPNDEDPAAWTRLPAMIDMVACLSAPAGRVLHEDPLVKSIPDLLPPAWCAWLIRQAASRLQPALVYDAVNKRNYRSSTRTNSIAQYNLAESEPLHFLIQARMSAACGLPVMQMEATSVLNYLPGQEIADHYDFVDVDLPDYEREIAENGQRVITFLIYLNEDYGGGETAFPKLGLAHKGRIGEGLYFVNALPGGKPDPRTLHAGRPPLSGEKWIVSQFIRNREVKYIL